MPDKETADIRPMCGRGIPAGSSDEPHKPDFYFDDGCGGFVRCDAGEGKRWAAGGESKMKGENRGGGFVFGDSSGGSSARAVYSAALPTYLFKRITKNHRPYRFNVL